MNDKSSKNEILNLAALAGLVLGGVSIAYFFLSGAVGHIQSTGINKTLSFILWAGKLCLCIYLMLYFMRKFANSTSDVTKSHVIKFGVLTALFSALIVAAFTYCDILMINSQAYLEAFDSTAEMLYKNNMDQATIEALDYVKENFGKYMFFGQLIYCFLFGTILSLILSGSVMPKTYDPFNAEDDEEEED